MTSRFRLRCSAFVLLQVAGALPSGGFLSFEEYQAIQSQVAEPFFCAQHGSCVSCTQDSCAWCSADERCHRPSGLNDTFCGPSEVFTDASSCPAPATPNTTFDLELSWLMTIYSDAAYFDPPETFGLPDGSNKVSTFSYTLGLWDEAFGFVAIDEGRQQIVISFRGTETLTQLAYELMHHAFAPLPGHEEENALVNEFFLAAVTDLLPRIQPVLDDLLNQCSTCKLYFTGHSLGASMASLAAFQFLDHRPDAVPILYTFGSPRVGNADFAALTAERIPEIYRVVNAADPIAHLPPCDIDPDAPEIRHGSCLKSRTGFYHAGTEIWFPAGQYENSVMCGFRVCAGEPSHEDMSCSDSVVSGFFPGSVMDHHSYWNVIDQGYCGRKTEPEQILV